MTISETTPDTAAYVGAQGGAARRTQQDDTLSEEGRLKARYVGKHMRVHRDDLLTMARTHCPRLANDYGNKGDCVTDIEYALQHYGTVNNEIVRHLAEAGGRVYDIIDGGNLYRSRDGFTYLRFFASPEMVNRLIAKYLGDDVTMVRVDDIMNFTRAAFGPPFTPEFCQVLRPMVPRTLSIILCQHWCFSPLALPGTRTYLTRHRSVILRFDKPFRRGRRV